MGRGGVGGGGEVEPPLFDGAVVVGFLEDADDDLREGYCVRLREILCFG